jgi:hypothetical protein
MQLQEIDESPRPKEKFSSHKEHAKAEVVETRIGGVIDYNS